MNEFVELLWLNLVVKKRNAAEWLKIVCKYYPKWRFGVADVVLRGSYFFTSPFRVSKRFLKDEGEEDLYTFGETPLTTFDSIVREAGVLPGDLFYDLGCGTGRTCFWLHHFVGCKVVGIEYVPKFVEKARAVGRLFKMHQVQFNLEDMLQVDFSKASVVYLYGSCFDGLFITRLCERLSALPKGAKVITVSYPLSDYIGGQCFEVFKTLTANYTWGVADVYIQTRV